MRYGLDGENEKTQQEVADAIGASVRTYQKWEKGETVPDGHNLLRLLNWLQIESVQQLIKYSFQEDDGLGLSTEDND